MIPGAMALGKVGPAPTGSAFDLTAPAEQLAAATGNAAPANTLRSVAPARANTLLSFLGITAPTITTIPTAKAGAPSDGKTLTAAPTGKTLTAAPTGKTPTPALSQAGMSTYLKWALVLMLVAMVARYAMQRFGSK